MRQAFSSLKFRGSFPVCVSRNRASWYLCATLSSLVRLRRGSLLTGCSSFCALVAQRTWVGYLFLKLMSYNATSIGGTGEKCVVGGEVRGRLVGHFFLVERSGAKTQEAGRTAVRVFSRPMTRPPLLMFHNTNTVPESCPWVVPGLPSP